jgi:tetratricopeptide (TPR) repeat protein
VDGGDGAKVSGRESRSRKQTYAGIVVLILAIGLVFVRVTGFEFLLYDDDKYLTANPVMQKGLTLDSVAWAFSIFHEGTYQPVTWLSYLTDISMFGMNPGPLHAVNLLLHLLVSLMVWRVLERSTGRRGPAFVVALLFALHPLQVQSVAWIAERKGLLAALFGLVAIDQWVGWIRTSTRRSFIIAHAAFAVSLLAKPVWLPLPVLLLLWDRWPLGRVVQLREKLPLFAIALGGAILAGFAQASASALSSISEVGIGPRLASAMLAWASTLRRLVAPFDLAAFYPFRFDHALSTVLWSVALLIAGSLAAWMLRNRRPAWTTGWFWWLILQAPAVGLLQFGSQGTADRFSYLPLIGLLVMLVYGFAADQIRGHPAIAVTAVVVLAAGLQSSIVLRPWHDTVQLFEHSIARGGGSALEHQNLCKAYLNQGDTMAAMRHSSRAVHYAPYSPTTLFQQADLLFGLGNYGDALERYREGLKFDPGRAAAWAQVARLYTLSKEWPLASRSWYLALEREPDNVIYVLGLASAMRGQGLVEEELSLYQRALELAPALPGVRSEIGWIHATSTDDRFRDPAVALRLAETDLRISNDQSARAIEVQAAARAALGETEEAKRLTAMAEAQALSLGEEQLATEIRERRTEYLPESR